MMGPHVPLSTTFAFPAPDQRLAPLASSAGAFSAEGRSRPALSPLRPSGTFAFKKWIPPSLQTLGTVPGTSGVPQLPHSQVTRMDAACTALLPLTSRCIEASAVIDGTNHLYGTIPSTESFSLPKPHSVRVRYSGSASHVPFHAFQR